ncbi:MAG: beta-1,6-N-acetylglucosaminyltransferase [Rhizomicrobium sp.]
MIAYFLLVHRYPEQFKRLFRAIHDPKNLYLIHVDKNSGPELDSGIRDFLSAYPNAAILKGEKAVWGGYSLVDAALRGMAELLNMSPNWEYFINLSGQDFPLKSQSEIRQFLIANRGTEFIKVLNQQTERPDTMARVRRYAIESQDGIVQTDASRPFLQGATPYIGNQWMVVSRRFCQFVTHDPRTARFKAFYKNTFIADEGFFQTVMMNTEAHGTIHNDDLRAIDWVPDGLIKLRPRTFTIADAPMLIASPALFARKFDESVDKGIFTALEHHIGRADRTPLQPRRPPAIATKTLVAA